MVRNAAGWLDERSREIDGQQGQQTAISRGEKSAIHQ
jgi:hypothetical protein